MQHDPVASSHDDPRAGVWAQTDGPLADATRLGRHLSDLARSGTDTPRPFARRRAASITSFLTDHDNDFARAGLAADRRASLVVRAARLEAVVAWEDWDAVRAIVAGMTFGLSPYLFPARAPAPEPPPTSRNVRLLWRLGRHRTTDDVAEGGERNPSAEGARPSHSDPDERA
jgi:hypothetical protein